MRRVHLPAADRIGIDFFAPATLTTKSCAGVASQSTAYGRHRPGVRPCLIPPSRSPRSPHPPAPSESGKFLTTDDWESLKAAGFSEAEFDADQPFGPLIFAYTRQQAIEDGVLVDCASPRSTACCATPTSSRIAP